MQELLARVGLVVDGDAVVDFQHLDDAGELGDDVVSDPHCVLHRPGGTAGALAVRAGRLGTVGVVAAEVVRAGTGDVVGGAATCAVLATHAIAATRAVAGAVAGMLRSMAWSHEVAARLVERGAELLMERLGGTSNISRQAAIRDRRRERGEVAGRTRGIEIHSWLSMAKPLLSSQVRRLWLFGLRRRGRRRLSGLGVDVFDLPLDPRADGA